MIRTIAIKSGLDPKMFQQRTLQIPLFTHTALLRIEIHCRPTLRAIIHEPHRERHWIECEIRWDALSAISIEPLMILSEHREAASREPVGDTRPSAFAGLRGRAHERSKLFVFPIDIFFECKRMIHFEERIGSCSLLPERSIAQKTANENRALQRTQTSHGITEQHK